ncbi:MAG: heme ABC transporter ATP-binding protein, partial [Pseudomonadota bacterium]
MNARSLTDFSKPVVAAPQWLEATDISVTVPGKILLHPLSARFAAGQVTVILGPNGAGKSTLMSVLTGQRQPGQGRVELNGQALGDFEPAELARLRAFVAQESAVAFDFSVQEVVELGRYPHRKHPSQYEADIATQAMQATAVDHLADRPINTLSGGEKARAHLARALTQVWEQRPKGDIRWLLLDEPTAALDLEHQHRVLKLARHWARTQGIGVVAVLHDLNLALRYSDSCIVLQQGRVAGSGLTAEVLSASLIGRVWNMAAWPVSLPLAADGGARDEGGVSLQ